MLCPERGVAAGGGDARPVHGSAGARRDEAADDDLLLEAVERVDLALHGRLGQYPGRLLAGGGRDAAAGLQARLGDAQERTEERRVGKEGVRSCSSWWSPYPYKKKQ